jgi:hypothetical protein
MRRTLVIPVLLAALVAATACGGGSGGDPGDRKGGGPSENGSFQRFAACMREKGQNVPDPDPDSNVAITPPAGSNSSEWQAAMQACRQYLPAGGEPGSNPEELEALRQYAACMREHGVEMTDPDPTTGNSQFGGRFASLSKEQIQNDPTYKTAQAACREIVDKAPEKDDR